MRLNELYRTTGETFTFYPEFTHRFGISVNACVLLCFIGWKTIPDKETDWRHFSIDDICKATGLSAKEQTTARKQLVEKRLIEEQYKRLDHELQFRLGDAELESVNDCPTPQTPKGSLWNSPKSEMEFPQTPKGSLGNSQNVISSIDGKESEKEVQKERSSTIPQKAETAFETDPVQEALAQWIQAFGDFNPTPYFAGSAKQRKADYAAIKLLVKAGRTPEQIGETARKMFEVASKAVNGKVAWWSTRCKTPTHYVAHQNEIIGELGLINGSTSGTATAMPASDDKFLKRWTLEQGPVREQFRDDSSFRAHSQAWQKWLEGKA